MVKKKSSDTGFTDRHVNPRVAFYLPQSWLDALEFLRKKGRRTITAEIKIALEEHFKAHQTELGDKFPPLDAD